MIPVALGFPFPSITFMIRLRLRFATLLEVSFQPTFTTRLASCWAVWVFTDMPGFTTSETDELRILPRTSLCFFYAIYTCCILFFPDRSWSFCSHCSKLSTFSQFSAISSALFKVRPWPSSKSFCLMYVRLHLQRISSRI